MQSTIKEHQSQGHRQDFDKGGYMMRIVGVAAGQRRMWTGFSPPSTQSMEALRDI